MQVDEEQQGGQEDSSSDSESDLDAADISEEDSRRIMELEAALQENPNQYDTHVQVGRLGRQRLPLNAWQSGLRGECKC